MLKHIPSLRRHRGQVAVESALILPLMLFTLLGILQLTLAYHARLVTELAAYKAARAASLYRLDCQAMRTAALIALIPALSVSGGGSMTPRQRYEATARKVFRRNEPPDNPAARAGGVPQVVVDYRLTGDVWASFDKQLDPVTDPPPMEVHVRLVNFFEYKIPFANWIMTRTWLASQGALAAWTSGANPLMLASRTAPGTPRQAVFDASLLGVVRRGVVSGYFTTPIVARWTARMMSDPLPGRNDTASHRCAKNGAALQY